jgi:Flp pilus assembly protein TadD
VAPLTRFLLHLAVLAPVLAADSSYGDLDGAYAALRARRYDAAVGLFRKAIAGAPQKPAIHKDLAYTLLKIGENQAAREEFAEAARLDPADDAAAMEYAFLAYETGQETEARRTFDRIRKKGNPTAETAFQNIDRPLAEGIERWKAALQDSPDNFSAHHELARLAEQRDEIALAAENYQAAWKLKPSERSLLLDLGRVWKAVGNVESANAALLAASRGAQPRIAETARGLLPARYPYVYEFRKAIELDPDNIELHRELAYLLMAMNEKHEAELEFITIHDRAPGDLLSTAQLGFLRLARNDMEGARPLLDAVLRGPDPVLADRVRRALKMPQTLPRQPDIPKSSVSVEAKTLAEKSFAKGYLKDALKYLTIAHETDPVDFQVMLKLGWVYNMLHQDREAVRWFKLARQSPDAAISDEAGKAYRNLAPGLARFRTTFWAFPFFSTRWHDAFGYAQLKTETRVGSLPLSIYASTRFTGDASGAVGPEPGGSSPQYLSESSFIFGIGVATRPWHGATGWFEAGEAVKYLANRSDVGAAIPDYRGGVSFAYGRGHAIGSPESGFFAETNDDGIYVSRFQDDFLLYAQNRAGYTFAGGNMQLYANLDLTTDTGRQYWANFGEAGPGIRFRLPGAPKSMLFSVNFLRGTYTLNEGNPRRPNFWDLRAGFWYAFTR